MSAVRKFRLYGGDFPEDFPDGNLRLCGCQALGNEGLIHKQAKQRTRIVGRFGFNYDLAHREPSTAAA